jgi:digeranylgeranylglycerophospholipid reductase
MARPSYDLAIVGAGPIGSYTSILLRRMGFSIALIEEHPQIGRPVQCAGLVNAGIVSLPEMGAIEGSILNRIRGADLFSPNGTRLELRARTEKALSIDRAAFDTGLARRATDLGVDILLGRKVNTVAGSHGRWTVGSIGIDGASHVKAGSIILCDGSDHHLRRDLGLTAPLEFIPGISCEVQVDPASYDDGNVAIFTGKDIAPGFFAWAIPAGEMGRLKLGLCASNGGDLRHRLRRFLGSDALRSWIDPEGGRVRIGELSLTIGNVPIGPVGPYQRGILLLGDAAGMAKPTSGGGIYPGLLAACHLARSIEATGEGAGDAAFSRFTRSWKRGYGRELRRSMMLRRIVGEIEDHEIDLVLQKLRDSDVLDYINENGDIDRPFTLAAGAFSRDPSLARMIPRFLPMIVRALGS